MVQKKTACLVGEAGCRLLVGFTATCLKVKGSGVLRADDRNSEVLRRLRPLPGGLLDRFELYGVGVGTFCPLTSIVPSNESENVSNRESSTALVTVFPVPSM